MIAEPTNRWPKLQNADLDAIYQPSDTSQPDHCQDPMFFLVFVRVINAKLIEGDE